MTRRVVTLAVTFLMLLAACSDSSSTTTAADTSATTAGSGAGSVEIALVDLDPNTMLLTPSPASAAAGEITFEVTNTGTEEHEFVVLLTDLDIADLPYDDATLTVVEDGEGMTAIDEIESVMPGETKTLTVTLDAGNYALICNLAGHYAKGMRSAFTVN